MLSSEQVEKIIDYVMAGYGDGVDFDYDEEVNSVNIFNEQKVVVRHIDEDELLQIWNKVFKRKTEYVDVFDYMHGHSYD